MNKRNILQVAAVVVVVCGVVEGQGVTRVCGVGCDYATLGAALGAVTTGVIEVEAGMVNSGTLILTRHHDLTVRTSRWRELPAAGYRIDPVGQAGLLATVQAVASEPALLVGPGEANVKLNGVDVNADTISFDFNTGTVLENGLEVSCANRTPSLQYIPSPLQAATKYYIRDWNAGARTARFAATSGGAAIDLTDVGSAADTNYYGRAACTIWNQPRNITFQGIRFATSPGVFTRNLVQVGNGVESDPINMGPSNISFEHTVMTGIQTEEGPLFCVALFGGHNLSITDSWLGHCKQSDGNESKAVAINNVYGALIRNNYLSAASIILLVAGADAPTGDVNHDLVITGNFFEKPGYMMYKEGAGAPSGPCYYGGGSGAYYRRTDVTPNTPANGAVYTCQPSRTWALDTGAVYRSHNYLTKNMLEFKDCENCRVEGNAFVGGYAGPDFGQGWCFGVSVGVTPPGLSGGFGGGQHRGWGITFRNNWADYCYSGVFLTNSAFGGATHFQMPLRDIAVENNLFSHFGAFPELSQAANAEDIQRFGLKQSTGIQGLRYQGNTFRGSARWSLALYQSYLTGPFGDIKDAQFDNNIFPFNDVSVGLDSSSNDCTPTGMFKFFPNDTNVKRFRNNIFFGGSIALLTSSGCAATIAEKNVYVANEAAVGFAGSTNNRLASSSPFSAENPNPTVLARDGSSAGADVDVVEQYAIPAQLGVPSVPEQIQLDVVAGSTAAIIRFRRPMADTACQVALYSAPARVAGNEHPDTNTPASRLDSRPSSVVNSGTVQFVAGAVVALTPATWYPFSVDCGSLRAIGRFRTQDAVLTTTPVTRMFRNAAGQAVQVEIADNPQFSNATVLPSVPINNGAANVSFDLPSGVRYWRTKVLDGAQSVIEQGTAQVLAAP